MTIAVEALAAQSILESGELGEEFWQFPSSGMAEPSFSFDRVDETIFVRTLSHQPTPRFIIFPSNFFSNLSGTVRQTALERCCRAALGRLRNDSFLPPSWAPFSSGSLLLFFATTIGQGKKGAGSRALLYYNSAESPHVLVLERIELPRHIDLRNYRVSEDAIRRVKEVQSSSSKLEPPFRIEFDPRTITLRPSTQTITQGLTFDEWMPHLTKRQHSFVHEPLAGLTKLRGAAGTGKTVAITLKAIHDAYTAPGPWRSLILTHNWSAANNIKENLASIDNKGILKADGERQIHVATLQSLAIDLLQLTAANVAPISEDGHEGKLLQLDGIEGIVADFARADWSLFKTRCSDDFRKRLTAERNSAQARRFAWDLMNEFACVISAERGLTSERYVSQRRLKWMMHLPQEADREVVFILYTRFRKFFHEELGVLAGFDVVNDLLRYLDSNTWDVRRKTAGYDEIFIDEFHLFNKQEQLAFQYLTRDPIAEPRVTLAFDPRQSPSETFIGVLAETESITAARLRLGGARIVVLDFAFRYTKQINRFLASMEQYWFGFDLGEEFFSVVRDAKGDGVPPSLIGAPTFTEALAYSIRTASRAVDENTDQNKSVAILCLDIETFAKIQSRIEGIAVAKKARVIQSREEALESAQNLRRKFVVSQPEYVAGLQFDVVIIPDANGVLAPLGMDKPIELRRLLSAIYLAASRAKSELTLVYAQDKGGAVRLVQPALEQGVLIERPWEPVR